MIATTECQFEADVTAAVAARRLALPPAEHLRAHLVECPHCQVTARLVEALTNDHRLAIERAHVPPAGYVWHRAVVQIRAEAARTAARPVTWTQGLWGAVLAGGVISLGGLAWPAVRQWGGGLLPGGGVEGVLAAVPPVLAAFTTGLPLALAVAGVAVFAPLVVLYVALSGSGD